jgi:hypothetical protein
MRKWMQTGNHKYLHCTACNRWQYCCSMASARNKCFSAKDTVLSLFIVQILAYLSNINIVFHNNDFMAINVVGNNKT